MYIYPLVNKKNAKIINKLHLLYSYDLSEYYENLTSNYESRINSFIVTQFELWMRVFRSFLFIGEDSWLNNFNV